MGILNLSFVANHFTGLFPWSEIVENVVIARILAMVHQGYLSYQIWHFEILAKLQRKDHS